MPKLYDPRVQSTEIRRSDESSIKSVTGETVCTRCRCKYTYMGYDQHVVYTHLVMYKCPNCDLDMKIIRGCVGL